MIGLLNIGSWDLKDFIDGETVELCWTTLERVCGRMDHRALDHQTLAIKAKSDI